LFKMKKLNMKYLYTKFIMSFWFKDTNMMQ
jgi:hypothetical protein